MRARDLWEAQDRPRVVSPSDQTRLISSVEEWREFAGPLWRDLQWKDGRSAKEVAKAWCRSDGTVGVPPELQALLDSSPGLGTLRVATVIPELPTPLGDVPRGARRHDLVLLASASTGGRVLVGVEAKTDEPFDVTVARRLERALRRRGQAAAAKTTDDSAQIPRTELFAQALFGRHVLDDRDQVDAELGLLPYQLLAGAAGTLMEASARHASSAAFVVHAFHSDALDRAKVASNDQGFARFVEGLSQGEVEQVAYGRLLGPFHPPGSGPIPSLPLFLGIATSRIAS